MVQWLTSELTIIAKKIELYVERQKILKVRWTQVDKDRNVLRQKLPKTVVIFHVNLYSSY